MSPWPELLSAAQSWQAVWAAAVVLLGYTVLGISGFGSALLIVPALLCQWPLAFVVPLVLLLDLPAALFHAWLNRRDADLREWRGLLPWMLGGTALGGLGQGHADNTLGLALLGLGLCAAAVRGLRAAGTAGRAPDAALPAAGLGVGAIEALFGVCGPVASIWLSRRCAHPLALRATTALVLTTATSLALSTLAVRGQLAEPRLWCFWVLLLGLAMAGVRMGQLLAARLPEAGLRTATWCLVLASGLGLLGRLC